MRTRHPCPAPIARSAFAGFCFPPDVIVLAVRWYLRFVKGTQTRSWSLSVLVKETAEQVASVHNALVILAQDGQLGQRVWWL